MLIQLNIENFLSFKDEATLSFVANSTTKEHEPNNVFEVNEFKLLKSAAIYGSNASGKSNFLNGMGFMKSIVLNSFKNAISDNEKSIPAKAFKLNDRTKNESSFFEVVFIHKTKQFRYGFETNKGFVEKEWLYHVPNKIETILFEREESKIKINKSQFSEGKGLEKKTRSEVLFLSVCSQFNGEISNQVINWFKSISIISGINDDSYRAYTTHKLKKDKKFRKWMNKFISFLEITKLSVEEEFIEKLNIDELDIPDEEKELKVALKAIDALQQKQKTVSKLKAWHQVYNDSNILQDTVSFDFYKEESKGTQKLIYLLGPIYDSLVKGKLLFIDEMDSRLHSLLTSNLIKLFHKGNRSNAQFVFVVHDTSILTKEIFRRDQLWFVDKNQFGCSKLFSLSDYKKKHVRNDAKFNQNYLKGDFGSIPYINDIDKSIEQIYGEEE